MSMPPVIPNLPPAQAPPPRKNNLTPLFILLGIGAVGFIALCAFGFWFVQVLRRDAKPADRIPPAVVAELDAGWKRVQLDSIGLTLELPDTPVRRDDIAEDDEEVTLYDRYAAYRSEFEGGTVYVMAFRYKIEGVVELDDEADEVIEGFLKSPTLQNASGNQTHSTCANLESRNVVITYSYNGIKQVCIAEVFIDKRVTYLLEVVSGSGTNTKDTFDRIKNSITIHNSNASIQQKP